ncbi:MAG TPA: CHRD domain-containing protein [Thermoanaerobaculia bacterium]
MRRHALIVALSIFTLTTASAFGQTLGAVLTAAGEVPPTTSPGFGNATVTFDSMRQNITVTVTVANLGSPITAAHIHPGAAGQANSPIIAFTPTASFVNGKLTGTFPVDAATATAMLQNPSNFYVNVHTQQFPSGAIRGQLSAATGTVFKFAADMRGSNETPPNSSTATGSALVTIDTANNTLTFEIATKGIANPTLAHIHPGAAGVAGSPLITFATSSAAFTNGRTSGTISIATLDAGQLNNLLTNPSVFYVNVHSSAFGGGEIRGQLVAANEYDLPVAAHAQGIGTVFVTDLRIFNPSYDTAANVLVEFFPSSVSNTNAANAITVNIPARGTAVLNDVTGPSGLNATATTGAIRVTSAESLVATSRIYSDQRALGKGTLGQFAPAQQFQNALRRGVMPQLSNTAAADGSRTNIGFFNPNTQTVTVRLELRDNSGNLMGSNTITLQPLSQQQNSIGTYFPSADVSNAANLTLSFDASAPIDAYASVVDTTSTDQIFVPGQTDVGIAASQQ